MLGHLPLCHEHMGVLSLYLDDEAQGCQHGDAAVGHLGLAPPPELPAKTIKDLSEIRAMLRQGNSETLHQAIRRHSTCARQHCGRTSPWIIAWSN